MQLPNFWKEKPLCNEHYWEIGMKGYPKKRIIQSLQQTGLNLKREYQDPQNPYHYFFVLEKQSQHSQVRINPDLGFSPRKFSSPIEPVQKYLKN